MVLLHDIIQLFDLADFNRGAVLGIIALDGRFIGGTPVDGDRLWYAVAADRLGQKTFRGLLVVFLREQKVNRLTLLIHRAIELTPLPLSLNIGLVHAPADPD